MTTTKIVVATLSLIALIWIVALWYMYAESKGTHQLPQQEQPEIIYPEWTGEDSKG